MDKKMIDEMLNDLEDEDSQETGKKGLASLDDPQAGPADPDGSNDDEPAVTGPKDAAQATDPKPVASKDDKLEDLVASLTPEEKAKLLALLQAPDEET